MKTQISTYFILLILTVSVAGCKLFGGKKEDPTPVDTTPAYQKAIDAKYAQLGWDKDGHSKYNNTAPVKTTGGKGWVQYYAYGDRKTAIYYYEGKGAFAMDTEEMKAYDAAGQDNWGLVVSDPKATISGGCGYNDIITLDGKEAIITCQNLVYGNVYAKYKEIGRWDSPLGLPTSSELDTPPANPSYAKGRFNSFQNGAIWAFSTGTYAIWGKTFEMYQKQDWERGWLKIPKESCDPKKADNLQTVNFQGGAIKTGPTCPAYFNTNNETVYQNGTKAANVSSIPCY